VTDFTQHHVDRINDAHTRLDVHEARIARLETSEAVSSERYLHIKAALDKIQTTTSKVAWIVIAAVIGGVMTFIIDGGIHLGK